MWTCVWLQDFRFLVTGEYGEIDEENGSKWHEERNGSRRGLQKVIESQPENWQAVVQAFGRIKKKRVWLMLNYYARRGDMHRETFEKMQAQEIEPSLHV
ncbi:hypothetical protein ACS0TY_034295 [Phlomoides rotata]